MIRPLKNQRRNLQSSGYSLIELMVVAGLVGFIAIGIARFTKNFESSQAKSDARAYSHEMSQRLLGFIQRDFRYQTAFQTAPNQLRLVITRPQQYNANDPDATYQVLFQSECASPPAEMQAFINDVYNTSNRTKLLAAENPCLRRLACPNGQYPRVRIATNPASAPNDRIPKYQPPRFPDFDNPENRKNVRRSMVGAAVCFFNAGNRIRIVSQSVFLGGQANEEEMLHVTSDEAFVTTSNIAGVELIPNE
ncbi:MAG: PulJ/GspJ family protein [Oligoflexus sp.]